ncbi:MAG: MBL fold metallo-hydrolase [Candidatus Limnocylindrus sp. ZSMar2m-chloro-G89]|nr:MAG: MBL fold metallo-hydrolase [Candidatus Limnocylindrus sp.]RLT49506.1 MAG: MBL fold metallo-hydrolase [Candidatus Limnocylindrus sp. ZSMar2m-chloro-G89]
MSAAPLSGPQPPRRIDLGGVTVDLLQIGTFRSDAGAIFGPVPRTTWESLVHAEIDAASRLLQSLNLLHVQTSEANLLLETGMLAAGNTQQDEVVHSVSARDALLTARIDPDALRYVLPSHLHRDHAGGLVTSSGAAAFPKATIVAPQAEIDAVASRSARARAAYDAPLLQALFAESEPEPFISERQLLPQVELRLLGGHTPGSQATIMRGSERTLLFMGDLFMRPWQANPRWVTAFDDAAWVSVDAKAAIFAEAAAEHWLIVQSHELAAPVGHLVADRDRFRFVAE